MDLLSGYSDSYNPFPGGYSPAQNAAYNATMANAAANQAAVSQQSQNYDPFASSGGFGRQTDYYSSLGAAYGRGTGGFGGGGGAAVAPDAATNAGPQAPYAYDDSAGLSPSTAPNGGDGFNINDYIAMRSGNFQPQTFQPQPSQPQDYFADYTGSPYPGGTGSGGPSRDLYYDPDPGGGGTPIQFPQITNNDPYTALRGGGGGAPYNDSAGLSPSTAPSGGGLSPAQEAYKQQHIQTYGYAPPDSYFGGGGFSQRYGGGYNPAGDYNSGETAYAPQSSGDFSGRFDSAFRGTGAAAPAGSTPSPSYPEGGTSVVQQGQQQAPFNIWDQFRGADFGPAGGRGVGRDDIAREVMRQQMPNAYPDLEALRARGLQDMREWNGVSGNPDPTPGGGG